MSFRRVDEKSGAASSGGNSRAEWKSWKLVLFLLVTAVPAAIAWLQGHEMACRGSAGWQRLAGWFGDCSAYARAQPDGIDPIANAKQRIQAAGYTTTNADFIKAVARGESDVVGSFQTLGVKGDEQSLRAELLKSPVESVEFSYLAEFMARAHSKHYASRPREEIKAMFDQMRASKSVDAARKAACEKGGRRSFVEDLLRANLSKACADEARWVGAVISLAQKSLAAFDAETMVWWHMNAADVLHYVPAFARKMPLEEFSRLVKNNGSTKGYFQIDAGFSILPYYANISSVEVFVTQIDNTAFRFQVQGKILKDCLDEDPKRDEHLVEAQARQMHKDFHQRYGQKAGMPDLSDPRNYAYNAKPPRPKCNGTLTLLASSRGLGIVNFSNVRILAGSASR